MTGNLKYWLNGEPVLPDSGLDGIKYWLNGEPYVIYDVVAFETTTQTVTVKARIQLLSETTISAKARVQTAGVSSTITAKVNIKATIDTNIQAKADIKQSNVITITTSKARIEKTESNIISAKVNIKSIQSILIFAKARVQTADIATTMQARANIKATQVELISSKTRIQTGGITNSIITKARVEKTESNTITVKARIQVSSETSITTKARIQKTIAIIVQVKANIKSTLSINITAKARVSTAGVSKIIQAKASIERIPTTIITAKVNIKATTEYNISAKANIQKTNYTTISAKANITIKRIAYPWQRKHWFDGVRYWRANYDPANDRIMFEYSADLSSWTENVSARISDVDVSADFSVWGNGSYLYIVYSNGEDILGRKASAYPAINFVWNALSIIYDGSDDLGKYTYPNISYDGNGSRVNVLTTLQLDANNNYVLYNKRALGANQVPSEATAKHELVASQVDEVFGTIRRNTNAVTGSLIAIWKKGTAIQSAYRNGANNATDWEADQNIATGKTGTTQAICAEHSQTDGDTVLIYIDSDGKAHSKNRFAGSGQSWNDEGILDDDINCKYPCIGEHAADHFHLIWLDNDDHIRERIYDAGTDTWNPILANPPVDKATKPDAKWLTISDQTPRIHCCWEETDNSIDCLELLFNAEPTKPTDLETEGVTNPFGVIDLTPELTGLFHDADTGDKSKQYQIEVRISTGSFISAFQLTDLENMAVSGVSFGGSGKITVYGLGDVNPEGGYLESGGFTDSNVFSEARNIVINFTDVSCSDGATLILTYDGSQTLVIHLHEMISPDEHSGFITDDGSAWHDAYFSLLGYANPATQWLMSQADFSVQPGDGERCEEISYAGNTLSLDGSKYYWRIRMRDLAGAWSPWSDEVASFQVATEKGIQTKASIRLMVETTISAKGRIETLSTIFISAKASIQVTNDTVILTKARIKIIDISKDINTKARIQKTESNDISAKARLEKLLSKTIQAKSSIRVIQSVVISAKASIKQSDVYTIISGKANIWKIQEAVIIAKASIEKTLIVFIQAKTSIKRINITKSLTAKANLVLTSETDIQIKANIKVTLIKSITGKASIIIPDITKTIFTKTSIKKTESKTIQSKANINKPTKALGIPSRFFNTKVNIKRETTSKSNTGDLEEIFVVNQYDIPATIQLLTGEELVNMQGMVYNYTHRVFLPKAIRQFDTQIVYISIREGDMLYHQGTEISYKVKQIEDLISANKRKSGTRLHHYELLVEKINDSRYN